MSHARSLTYALTAAFALSACAGQTTALVPSQPPVPEPVLMPLAAPPPCKGQTTTTEYAMSVRVTLHDREGTTCIPSFKGFGGVLAYPAAKPAAGGVQFTSSTTNFNQMPVLHKGKPLFYLQFATQAATAFGAKHYAIGGLSAKTIVAGNAYSVYGQAKLAGVAGIMVNFTPCRATAVAGKGGGTIAGIGTVLEKENLSSPASIVIEVFPGKSATAPC